MRYASAESNLERLTSNLVEAFRFDLEKPLMRCSISVSAIRGRVAVSLLSLVLVLINKRQIRIDKHVQTRTQTTILTSSVGRNALSDMGCASLSK